MHSIPTVSDRVAQAAVKLVLEPELEPHFHEDSYGYRPGRSAHQAIAVTRKRCWYNDWVLEFDIRGLFDNIDHTLLMKSVRHHTACNWVLLYIERWLTAPVQQKDGTLRQRTKGTPQGGVVSPLLANLFMHYAFDRWMTIQFPRLPFCRYADDGLVHCRSLKQAEYVRERLAQRLKECGLELHPVKTRIVYHWGDFRAAVSSRDRRDRERHGTDQDRLARALRLRCTIRAQACGNYCILMPCAARSIQTSPPVRLHR